MIKFLNVSRFCIFWDLGFCCCCCLVCHYVSVTKNLRSCYRLLHLLNFAFSGCLRLLILIWSFFFGGLF